MQRDFFGSVRDAVLMADDWDLHAIVRSCKATATKAAAIKAPEEAFSFLEALLLEEEEKNDPFSFPNLLEQTTNGFQELHQLCQPFLSKTISFNDLETLNSNLNLQKYNHSVNLPSALIKQPEEEEDKQTSQNQKDFLQPDLDCSPTLQTQTPRARRRKFQQERIVCQVTAENLSTDMWAWRKYGQKPIKGSPHPRNYYRCSSSKGCSARKQVERSTSDPNTFTITYTGEHTHPPPLHKNSLAGSTRNKIPVTETTADMASTASSSSPSGLSPTTPFAVENEEESIKETSNAEEKGADEIAISEDDEDILIPNMAAMEDDIFLGLEGFGYGGVGRPRATRKKLTTPKPTWNTGSSSSDGATASGGSWKSPPQFAGR